VGSTACSEQQIVGYKACLGCQHCGPHRLFRPSAVWALLPVRPTNIVGSANCSGHQHGRLYCLFRPPYCGPCYLLAIKIVISTACSEYQICGLLPGQATSIFVLDCLLCRTLTPLVLLSVQTTNIVGQTACQATNIVGPTTCSGRQNCELYCLFRLPALWALLPIQANNNNDLYCLFRPPSMWVVLYCRFSPPILCAVQPV
jgi:hypothetical protein